MAMQISKVQVWAVELRDQPGGLADVLQSLASAGANLECVIARRNPDQLGSGVAFVTPIRGAKVESAARAAGLQDTPVPTLRVVGDDSRGIGARMMRAISDTGVNTRGFTASRLGGKFIAYIG